MFAKNKTFIRDFDTMTLNDTPKRARLWNRLDLVCGILAGVFSLVVYIWTAAPNVSLLDSGEFMVAAQHFGVPHPTAYPLWTFLTWLFQLIFPFGNAAWKINIFSGILGSLAVALAASLAHNATRWIFPLARWQIIFSSSLTFALLFAFSESMWSQAVIAEVYTLHALLIGIYLVSIYILIRRPSSDLTLILSFFFLTLAFSNHNLSLTLTPLAFIVILLLRREVFLDLLLGSFATGVLFYLLFGLLSKEQATLAASLRFAWCGLVFFIIVIWIRRLKINWNFIAYLPLAVAFGLLPYIYLPIASSTNPPMNWSYTQTPEGFYYAFNRSQYHGSLSAQLLRTIGKGVGVSDDEGASDEDNSDGILKKRGILEVANDWTGLFWVKILDNFTLLALPSFFLCIFAILRLELKKRVWIYLLNFAFILAAFSQPIADRADIDKAGWWLQMPYHTHTNLIFALLCSTGCAQLILWLQNKWQKSYIAAWGLLVLPIWTLSQNADVCSQRGRWFGWEFGYEILKDLPKDAVLFGGSDPGRFVPTYMIFGESGQKSSVKRDPDFDRSDVYIITQNATAEPYYLRYIADQYTDKRPKVKGWFEKFLGRDHHYPDKYLVLPDAEDILSISKEAMKQEKDPSSINKSFYPHSAVAEWIFKHNRDSHEFFVEESSPMEWSYRYAVPHGLILKLEKEEVTEISPELVKKDFQFWEAYNKRLLEDPLFTHDYDAQRSFSNLRTTIGNLYKHHKMEKEAEKAYRQALALYPENMSALLPLSGLLWEKGEFEEVQALLLKALENDINNRHLVGFYSLAIKRKEMQKQIDEAQRAYKADPANLDALVNLIKLHIEVSEPDRAADILAKSDFSNLVTNQDFSEASLVLFANESKLEAAKKLIKALQDAYPDSAEIQVMFANYYFRIKDEERAYAALEKALQLGGIKMRQRLRNDPRFRHEIDSNKFQEILKIDLLQPYAKD
ncbi:MAG: protein O-mannosyl-transferase family [Chthoniobacterales bacterium]